MTATRTSGLRVVLRRDAVGQVAVGQVAVGQVVVCDNVDPGMSLTHVGALT